MSRIWMVATLTLVLTPAIRASAALNAYMSVKGAKQGDIKGSVTQKGREGKIAVIAMSHEIDSARDARSGLPTGKRMHKPLVVTVEWDKSSPLLRQALATNENLPTVEIQFWEPSVGAGAGGVGAEKQYMTIKLTNANIVSIKATMLNNKDPQLMKFKEYDEIAFTYQKIEMTYTEGGIMFMDDWGSPSVQAPQTGGRAVARQAPDKSRSTKQTRIAARPPR